jgi:hypothetical protein
MANGTPNRTLTELLRGTIDLADDTLRAALYNDTTAFTFDPDTHEFVADVLDGGTTAEEFGGSGGTGYARTDVTGTTVTQDDTNDRGIFDSDDLTFAGLDNATIQGVIIYKQVGGDDTTPGDDPIIQVYDDDMADVPDLPIPTNGSDIQVLQDSAGVLFQEAV